LLLAGTKAWRMGVRPWTGLVNSGTGLPHTAIAATGIHHVNTMQYSIHGPFGPGA
jgi:hypothetical protein